MERNILIYPHESGITIKTYYNSPKLDRSIGICKTVSDVFGQHPYALIFHSLQKGLLISRFSDREKAESRMQKEFDKLRGTDHGWLSFKSAIIYHSNGDSSKWKIM